MSFELNEAAVLAAFPAAMPPDVQLVSLGQWPKVLPELAALLYQQWQSLYQQAGITELQLRQVLAERTSTDRLPLTLVLMKGDELLGAGSIKLSEPDTKAGLSTWLAGIYLKPAYRGLGYGALIVQGLQDKARLLGISRLYLSTDEAEGFYQRLGWQTLEYLTGLDGVRVALMQRSLAAADTGA